MVEVLPGQTRRLDDGRNRSSWVLRVAVRTSHSTYLTPSMEGTRLVQSPFLTLASLYEASPPHLGSPREGSTAPLQLLSYYGTCIGGEAGADAPRQIHCQSPHNLEIATTGANAKTALRIRATGQYLSAHADGRRVLLTRRHGANEAVELVTWRIPPAHPGVLGGGDGASDSTLRVSGVWGPGAGSTALRRRGAWCLEWTGAAAGGERAAPTPSHLRLCFNATSGFQYWQQRRRTSGGLPNGDDGMGMGGNGMGMGGNGMDMADPVAGGGVAVARSSRRWESIGQRPLSLGVGLPFSIELRLSTGIVSCATGGGEGWMTGLTSLTRLQLAVDDVSIVSYGSHVSRVFLWRADATARALPHGQTMRLLPPISPRPSVPITGAPRAYVDAPERFHVYNPSVAWHSASGRRVHTFAKVSSYSLCGPSDEYESVAAERHGDLLSFLVRYDFDRATGEPIGHVRALTSLNTALTRHVAYGDGPEDPRAVRLGGQVVLMLWARTRSPEYTAYAAVYPATIPTASEATPRVVTLRHPGCDNCKQKNWSPLVYRGVLYAEVGVEPRSILRIDLHSGLASPITNLTAGNEGGFGGAAGMSFPGVAELQRVVGATLHGGPPPIRIPIANRTRRAFLGLAHFNRLLLPAAHPLRLYHHVFYLFAPRPPFGLIAIGPPVMLPSEVGMIQFASGMLLTPDGESLVISFGEQDCEGRRATVPLAAVLADLRSGVKEGSG